jgi:hypothetical protein
MSKLKSRVQGLFTFSAFKSDSEGKELPGSRRKLGGVSKNMITDAGLNRIGTSSDWLIYCQVGTGATPASAGDTTLAAFLGGTINRIATNSSLPATAPHYVQITNTYRFLPGEAAGNLAEVGIGWGSPGDLFSRALILDVGGSPTAITVLPDEYLDVSYQFRYYAPASDATGTINLGGIDYAWTARAAGASSDGPWAIGINGTAGDNSGSVEALSGSIGAVTGYPSGSSGFSAAPTFDSYSSGSFERSCTITFGLGDAVFVGGLGAFVVKMGIGTYQVGFSPKIPKTSEQVLTLDLNHSWARKTL